MSRTKTVKARLKAERLRLRLKLRIKAMLFRSVMLLSTLMRSSILRVLATGPAATAGILTGWMSPDPGSEPHGNTGVSCCFPRGNNDDGTFACSPMGYEVPPVCSALQCYIWKRAPHMARSLHSYEDSFFYCALALYTARQPAGVL